MNFRYVDVEHVKTSQSKYSYNLNLEFSAGIFFFLQVIGNTLYKEGATWKAETNLSEAIKATAEFGSNADLVSWWCDRGDVKGCKYSIIGRARMGGFCDFPGNTNLIELDKFHAGAGVVTLKLNQNVLTYTCTL